MAILEYFLGGEKSILRIIYRMTAIHLAALFIKYKRTVRQKWIAGGILIAGFVCIMLPVSLFERYPWLAGLLVTAFSGALFEVYGGSDSRKKHK